MARLKRGDYPLQAAQRIERGNRLFVGDDGILGPADVVEVAVLRADAGIVETRRHGVRVEDVAVVRLEEHRLRAVEHAEASAVDGRRMFAGLDALSSGFNADKLHSGIVDESGEEAHGVRAAADACDRLVGKTTELLKALPPRLASDDALEVTDHLWIRRRPRHRADHVERVVAVGDPVAQRFVHRVLERRAALGDRMHRRAEHLHALYVRRLPFNVYRAHVDVARHPEKRGDSSRGDAMHSCASLRYEALLAHALRQERLADGVVHLVRAGVVEVLPLQNYRRAAEAFRKPTADGQGRFPADVVL